MTTLRCGRIDAHPPHDWSRPPGWSRPRRTYHCEGAPAVEGGHREITDMRKPGEAFCSDCPDHEACMTNWPCSAVKRIGGVA